jgi:hypothetical protein
MADSDRLEISVADTQPPVLHMTLTEAVEEDSLLRLRASGTAMLQQLHVESVKGPDGQTLPIRHRYSRKDMQEHWMWYIRSKSSCVFRVVGDLAAGDTVEIHSRYGSDDDDAPRRPTVHSGLSWYATLEKIDDPTMIRGETVTDELELYFTPGPPEYVEAYLKPNCHLKVQHYDANGNPAIDKPPQITITAGEKEITADCSFSTAATSVNLREPIDRVHVRDPAGRKATSSALPLGLDGTPIFFGEFHWHTDFSGDGQRSLEEALKSARDELCLDFAGPADHMDVSGTYGEHTPEEQTKRCRAFDDPGRFCTIPGAELSRRYGHANIHCDDFHTLCEVAGRLESELGPFWQDENRYGLHALALVCPPGRCLIVPHHTNMTSGEVVQEDGRPFWCAMNWPLPPEREVTRLVEIVQGRGSFETEEVDHRWRVRAGGYSGSVRTALARGYRMGFTGGTDNHKGWPTRKGTGYAGLTAVQTNKLTTAGVFVALRDRRCYATSGVRIVADARMNGHPIGSDIHLEPGEQPHVKVMIKGTAPLTDVQIIHAGHVFAEFEVERGTTDFHGEWTDERTGRPLENVYYYVRARQENGHCVWLSPWWISLPE